MAFASNLGFFDKKGVTVQGWGLDYAFLPNSSIWFLNVSLLSMLIPSSITSSVDKSFMSSKFKTYESDMLFNRTMNWIFSKLAFTVMTFVRSHTKSWNISGRFFLQLYKVLLTAKLQKWDCLINKNNSFAKMLKRQGQRMDLWGTPVIISYNQS